MDAIPVLFRRDPVAPADHTSSGIGIRRRPPRRQRLETLRRLFNVQCQLMSGPFLAAFDALDDVEVSR